MIGPIEWESEEERARRRHQHKASTIHGWIVKMRGTLFGSESTRRAGIREMREAHAIRVYKKEHPEHFRGQRRGGFFWIFPRRNGGRAPHEHHDGGHHGSHSNSRHRHHSRRDDRHHPDRHDYHNEYYYGDRRHGPCLHFHPRVKPYHHGHATYITGSLFRRHDLRDKGRHLKERAEKERRRERRRRRRQRRTEVDVMRADRAVNKHHWW